MKKNIDFKIYRLLIILGLISVICIFPYILTLQKDVLEKTGISIPTLFIAQLVQTFILFSITIFLGLFFTKKINFQLPLLQSIVAKKKYQSILKKIVGQSTLFGIGTAMSIYGVDELFTQLGVTITTHQNAAPAWQTLLAAVYGGITEEIIMRLFLMTLIIWLCMKIGKRKEPTSVCIYSAIVLAAIIFGLGHLPITATLTTMTPLVIARAITLNGIGGIVFGWLFWKKGLESAMIAHFTADVFLLTLLPLLIK